MTSATKRPEGGRSPILTWARRVCVCVGIPGYIVLIRFLFGPKFGWISHPFLDVRVCVTTIGTRAEKEAWDPR